MLAWRDVSAVRVRSRRTKAAAVAQRKRLVLVETQLKFQTGAAAGCAAATRLVMSFRHMEAPLQLSSVKAEVYDRGFYMCQE